MTAARAVISLFLGILLNRELAPRSLHRLSLSTPLFLCQGAPFVPTSDLAGVDMLRRLQSVVSAAIYIYAGCMILRTRPQGASLAVWSNNPNNRPQAGYSLTADLLGVGLGPPFSADVHDRSADRGITLSYSGLVRHFLLNAISIDIEDAGYTHIGRFELRQSPSRR